MAIIICDLKIYQAWKLVTVRAGGLFWALVTSMLFLFSREVIKGAKNRAIKQRYF